MTKANFAPHAPRSSHSVDDNSPQQADHGPFPTNLAAEDDNLGSSTREDDNGGGTTQGNGSGG